MTTTATNQESKVTLNIVITAEQVQEGDKVRVTQMDGDREVSYTGVAHHLPHGGGKPSWRTADGWVLWTAHPDVVIELLDRPLPKVPNQRLAIVHYNYLPYEGATPDARTAVRDADGRWNAYDSAGFSATSFHSDESFAKYVAKSGGFTVAFGGVAK